MILDDLKASEACLPPSCDVLVLGAGPAGLTAAWALLERGRGVVVVEKSDAAGGLCRSHEREGFFFDLGGHRFITKNPALFERVQSLMGSELRVRERLSVIRIRGREYRYPLDFREVLRGEGVLGIVRIVASYLAGRLGRKDGEANTLESWLRSRFGDELFRRFFRDYTRKLWGLGADDISADWAGKRIAQIDLKDFIRHALGLRHRPPRTFAARYCYPRHGIGQIFGTIADRVAKRGGVFSFHSSASAIERAGTGLRVRLDTPRGTEEIRCRKAISTIPLPDLVALLDAPPEVRAAATGLRFRGLRFLNLLLEGPQLSDRTWVYVPEKEFLMTRVQFPANRSPENCPPGKTSIQLEIPGDPADSVWTASDEELLERCLPELRRLGFDVEGRLLDFFTTRARHAYPVYDRFYRVHRERVTRWLSTLADLRSCGRQGGFNYIFFDRAMENGLAAALWAIGESAAERTTSEDPLLPEEARSIVA